MVTKSKIVVIATIVALSYAGPVFAQSFNRSDGTGNELPSYYDSAGGLITYTELRRLSPFGSAGVKRTSHFPSAGKKFGSRAKGNTMSVYDNLRDHLQKCDLQSLRMSFIEIENLIGRSLPPIARKWSEWWANGAWQTVGYDAEVNITEETVTFRRKKS